MIYSKPQPRKWIRCDVYDCTAEVRLDQWEELPKNWTVTQVHDCGLTGYTREEHRCPKHKED